MKLILLILSVTFSYFTFSQNITFDQIQNSRKKNLADVETFLTAKGWSMTEAVEATEDQMGMVIFGYDIDPFDNGKASGWVVYYSSNLNPDNNRIKIQVQKPAIYSTFLTRMTANGYKLKTSKIENGEIKKIYKNAAITCVVTTSVNEGVYSKKTAYTFLLISNISYKLYFEDKE